MFERAALALLLIGCAHARPAAATTETTSSEAAPPGAPSARDEETFECHLDRLAVLDAMTASRSDHTCTTAADCRVVTGPAHPDPEYAEVVFAADADALDARAEAHLARCGAFAHHEAIDAYREIEATCAESHCAALETHVHVDPIE